MRLARLYGDSPLSNAWLQTLPCARFNENPNAALIIAAVPSCESVLVWIALTLSQSSDSTALVYVSADPKSQSSKTCPSFKGSTALRILTGLGSSLGLGY